jgi:hypothetical protein
VQFFHHKITFHFLNLTFKYPNSVNNTWIFRTALYSNVHIFVDNMYCFELEYPIISQSHFMVHVYGSPDHNLDHWCYVQVMSSLICTPLVPCTCTCTLHTCTRTAKRVLCFLFHICYTYVMSNVHTLTNLDPVWKTPAAGIKSKKIKLFYFCTDEQVVFIHSFFPVRDDLIILYVEKKNTKRKRADFRNHLYAPSNLCAVQFPCIPSNYDGGGK